jgi:uncharacterized membrane protein YccC
VAGSPSTAGSALARLLRDAARLDRGQSDPVVSARNALGVAAPLAAGTLAGSPAVGLAMTIGAIQTAFADRPGPYRLRMLRMLGTACAATVTSMLAVVASLHPVASVALVAVLAFLAGLLTVGGPAATQVGTAGVAAALILGHLGQPASVAPHVGFLVFAGGAVQTLLALAGWPLRRHRPERVALAGLYRELATAARAQPGTAAGPPAGDTLTAVRQTLYGLGSDHGPSVEAYRVLLDEAERIRRELVVLGAAAERLREGGRPIDAGLVRAALTAVAGVLDEVAAALDEGRPVREDALEPARAALRHAVEALDTDPADRATGRPPSSRPGGTPDGPVAGSLTRRAASARLRALSGQLRAAVESTRAGASEGRRAERPDVRGVHVLRDPWEILRANVDLQSAVLRHAVRLALLVPAADAVVRAMQLNRGYWVPLTVLVVLRPDFATTWKRASMRMVGTVVGLFLATELVHVVPGGQWWHVVLVALFMFGTRFAGPGNIALTAVSLSGLVVVLLEIQGVPARDAVVSRALATVVGGLVAVLAAAAFLPAWERRFVPARLGELLGAYRRYLDAVADPDVDRAELHRARAASRLARSNAQSSVDRVASEPVEGRREVELGRTVLAHTHRFIAAMLALDAVRVPLREAGGSPELEGFLAAAGEVLDAARTSLLSGTAPGAVPKLRPRQERLREVLDAGRFDLATAGAVVEATDRVTNSLDTLVAELRRQLPVAS